MVLHRRVRIHPNLRSPLVDADPTHQPQISRGNLFASGHFSVVLQIYPAINKFKRAFELSKQNFARSHEN
jgi:hypothetical protein